MGYRDENIRHKLGPAVAANKKFVCPKCKERCIVTKATFIICSSCKKVVEGKDVID